VVDEHTVVLLNKEIDPDFLFLMGQATAIIVEPKSAEGNATKPVGTGPYKLDNWVKGSSVVLSKWDGYRNKAPGQDQAATFRFIADPAAQVAALLAGDVDAFPRVTPRSVPQFKTNPKFQVMASGSRPRPSWPSTTRRSRWTTCACAAPSTWPSTARPSSRARATATARPSAATTCPAPLAMST
jgi:ABC-type transport system substrate-binding protein